MAKITGNRLLFVSILIVAFYWFSATLAPHPYVTISNNILLFVASGFGLWRYREKTADIVFRGERVRDENGGYGGYLAVYGIFLVFLGSFYSALYSSTWIYMGEPREWVGSSYAQFGRFLTVCGFASMAASPDITKKGFVLPDQLWAIVLVLIALFSAGFYLGTSVDNRSVINASCPAGWVLGSSNKIYHTKESPYLSLVKPSICFQDEDTAIGNGFRKWKG